jgi:formate dehydrogenase subunit delta
LNSDSPGAAAHSGPEHGGAEHLIKMANDIGNFFRSEPIREDAVAGIANHIAKFWTKRMREKIGAHIRQAGDGDLDDLPREALRRLLAQQAAAPPPPAPQSAAH